MVFKDLSVDEMFVYEIKVDEMALSAKTPILDLVCDGRNDPFTAERFQCPVAHVGVPDCLYVLRAKLNGVRCHTHLPSDGKP